MNKRNAVFLSSLLFCTCHPAALPRERAGNDAPGIPADCRNAEKEENYFQESGRAEGVHGSDDIRGFQKNHGGKIVSRTYNRSGQKNVSIDRKGEMK